MPPMQWGYIWYRVWYRVITKLTLETGENDQIFIKKVPSDTEMPFRIPIEKIEKEKLFF